MPWDPLVRVCLARPTYMLMERAYHDYVLDSAPCKNPGIDNQCAVRMSVALGRCGCDLIGFPNRRRVHSGRPTCQLDIEHVVGARELADHLVRVLGPPQRFGERQADDARATLANRRGIIYFNNCFRREAAGRWSATIRLFDGSDTTTRSSGWRWWRCTSRRRLFHRADQVWFFPVA